MFALFLNLRAITQSSTGSLVFFQIGNGLKFLIWTQGEIRSGNRLMWRVPYSDLWLVDSFTYQKIRKVQFNIYILINSLKSTKNFLNTCQLVVVLLSFFIFTVFTVWWTDNKRLGFDF